MFFFCVCLCMLRMYVNLLIDRAECSRSCVFSMKKKFSSMLSRFLLGSGAECLKPGCRANCSRLTESRTFCHLFATVFFFFVSFFFVYTLVCGRFVSFFKPLSRRLTGITNRTPHLRICIYCVLYLSVETSYQYRNFCAAARMGCDLHPLYMLLVFHFLHGN